MSSGPFPYRDSKGKALADYPHPSVAVDTAVLTVPMSESGLGRLSVLLTLTNDAAVSGADEWRLPGTFLHVGETLSDAVLRSLREKAGVEGLQPRQLRVFDAPDRDERGWVLSVAHLVAVPADRIPLTGRTQIVPVDELPTLQYDHAEIVDAAVKALRDEYLRAPDPANLLPDFEHEGTAANEAAPTDAFPLDAQAGEQGSEPDGAFTMRDLRSLHESVLGERLIADTFRRTMLSGLEATGLMRHGVRGKPAELFLRTERKCIGSNNDHQPQHPSKLQD
ncbi:MAG: NUDIX hydrolase [Microbacteriaceae bacterium]|nr:NUDIX hydrolase [Microbacteriaceae bacterium]